MKRYRRRSPPPAKGKRLVTGRASDAQRMPAPKPVPRRMRLVLIGDGDSPHLLKWARALAVQPDVEVWAASSRGFMSGFDAVLPAERRLALGTQPRAGGGNVGVLGQWPRLVCWLRQVQPDWLHAHYLTSHGTLAWAARRWGRFKGKEMGRLVGSAWGSDILVTPRRGPVWRWLTTRVLNECALTTSDSQFMAQRMRELGAAEVMVFPFGLEAMPEVRGAAGAGEAAGATDTPPGPPGKDPRLVFANRGLEPIYQPQRVLRVFAAMAAARPGLRLVVANDGSLRKVMQAQAQALGLGDAVRFVGRLDAEAQAGWYARAQWYLSLPRSDSVAVSVLEAMAHGCIPLLSDLPANRELVRHGDNGLIVADDGAPDAAALQAVQARAADIARDNRAWVQAHALFAPAVRAFVERLRSFDRA